VIKSLFQIFFSLAFCFACSKKNSADEQIKVFCASSLANVLEEIKSEWEKTHEERIVLNFASSGTLARQIEYGAEADIYISANHAWMQYVQETTKSANMVMNIARNRLVLVADREVEMDSLDFESSVAALQQSNDKIAIGDPGHVPLGKYTRSTLEHAELSEDLADRIILAKDARSTLRLVELGEAGYGFVYLTDAMASEKVKVIAIVPEKLHEEIRYEVALFHDRSLGAESFLEFLTSSDTSPVWKGHGFIF